MNVQRHALNYLIYAGASCLVGLMAPAEAQIAAKPLKNVRGMDTGKLVGTECRGTFAVPGSRSESGMGAFKVQLFERDGTLSGNYSRRFGAEAFKNPTDSRIQFEDLGVVSDLEVEGHKVTFVSSQLAKWEFE